LRANRQSHDFVGDYKTQRVRQKLEAYERLRPISNQQPPIADLEHPYTFSIINSVSWNELIRHTASHHSIDSAECIGMFQIGWIGGC
jgi:hypothetical protein